MPFPAILAGLLPLLKAGGVAAAAAGGGAAANKVANKIHQKISSGGSGGSSSNIRQGGPIGSGSSIKDKLLGTQNRIEQIANRTPEQMAAQSAALQQALGNIKGNQFDFAPIEQLSRENFERKTAPSIQNMFASSDGLRSGGYNRFIASAGKDLDTQLAALRSQHALGQQGLNQQLLQLGLAPQFENAFFPGTPGALDKFGEQAFNPENMGSILQYIKQLLSKQQDAGQIQQPVDQQQTSGDFGQNQQLQEFANQGVAQSNPLTQWLNQASGQQNLNNSGLQNTIAQQGAQAGLGASSPSSLLGGLKNLYPQANL